MAAARVRDMSFALFSVVLLSSSLSSFLASHCVTLSSARKVLFSRSSRILRDAAAVSFLSNDCFRRLSEAIELNMVDLREDLRLEEEEEAPSPSGVSGTIVIILRLNLQCLVLLF